MSAKFTPGPYQRNGRHIHVAQWSATVHPFCNAVDTAELESVATLFQAAPLLYEALEAATEAYAYHYGEDCPLTIKCRTALRAARGEI